MKKIIKNQSALYKKTNCILISVHEFGAGSTYRNELRILFISADGIIKSIKYKYTLKNVIELLRILFIPYKLDKKIISDFSKKIQ